MKLFDRCADFFGLTRKEFVLYLILCVIVFFFSGAWLNGYLHAWG